MLVTYSAGPASILRRFNVPPCLRARPLVSLQYLIESRVRNGLMSVHHPLDRLPDLGKPHAFFEKRFDRNFIGGVQNSRKRAAGFAGSPRQVEGREVPIPRLRKF